MGYWTDPTPEDMLPEWMFNDDNQFIGVNKMTSNDMNHHATMEEIDKAVIRYSYLFNCLRVRFYPDIAFEKLSNDVKKHLMTVAIDILKTMQGVVTMQTLVTEVQAGMFIDYRGIRAKVSNIKEYCQDFLEFTLSLDGEDDVLTKRYNIISSVEVLPEKVLEWEKGIDTKAIPYDVWMQIAAATGTYDNVATKKWVEHTYPELLATLSIQDWRNIAQSLGYTDKWAMIQYSQSQN